MNPPQVTKAATHARAGGRGRGECFSAACLVPLPAVFAVDDAGGGWRCTRPRRAAGAAAGPRAASRPRPLPPPVAPVLRSVRHSLAHDTVTRQQAAINTREHTESRAR